MINPKFNPLIMEIKIYIYFFLQLKKFFKTFSQPTHYSAILNFRISFNQFINLSLGKSAKSKWKSEKWDLTKEKNGENWKKEN